MRTLICFARLLLITLPILIGVGCASKHPVTIDRQTSTPTTQPVQHADAVLTELSQRLSHGTPADRGQAINAIQEYVIASRQLPRDQRQANEEALWALLLRIDQDPLQQLMRSPDADTRGWATLAYVYRESGESAALLARRINAWLADNPQHPAAEHLPDVVAQAARATAAIAISQVAVLLPLHGKLSGAGIALQRGIIAAWFSARESGTDMPQLHFYDSSRSDFPATYDAAVKDGADMILGPLEKEHLRLLQLRDTLPVTTIALNYPDTLPDTPSPETTANALPNPPGVPDARNATVGPGADAPGKKGPEALYYLGLAGEDEAAQIARFALQSGLKRVALLLPAGEWGQRIGQQLLQTVATNGGTVLATGVYQGNGDYNKVVHDLLDVQASELRHGRLERLLGNTLGFLPRRRPDIDALLIIANTAQAAQLVPAAHYYYARGVPMFATSHINGQLTVAAANDLAGVLFVDMPWIADPNQPLRQRVAAAWQDVDERYLRLYALGIDAWRLSQHLPLLAQSPEATIEGATGLLTLDQSRRIHRELAWMIFRDGRAERIHGSQGSR